MARLNDGGDCPKIKAAEQLFLVLKSGSQAAAEKSTSSSDPPN